jgi:hypothetical protein
MPNPKTILEWRKEAGAYAFKREDPDRPGGRILVDVVVSGGTVGVRVRRPGAEGQHYQCLTWTKIERAQLNPQTQLIDDTIAGKSR